MVWPLFGDTLKYSLLVVFLWEWGSDFCWALHQGRLADRDMPLKRRGQPVSRELVKIIRENSKLETSEGVLLSDHMHAIGERQAKAVEFYLRGCALRLDSV
jgi:hypothetical protein